MNWTSEQIVELRRRFELSQPEFAALLKMTQRSLSRLETGATSPTKRRAEQFDLLKRVADWLDSQSDCD